MKKLNVSQILTNRIYWQMYEQIKNEVNSKIDINLNNRIINSFLTENDLMSLLLNAVNNFNLGTT